MNKHENSNSELSESKQDEETHPYVKPNRIKFVAKLLMDNKYGLMDDLNYIRGFPEYNDNIASTENVQNGRSGDYLKQTTDAQLPPVLAIPRSTIIKADRVRIYLDYYYSILERCINIESSEHHHEGVEGVYNPLQVIRNRKLRKKYHEMPPRELSIQKAPVIAIKQFSKRPNKKMPWFVDLGERSSDLTWRTSHWDELVDPSGNLWFGNSKSSTASPGKESHRYHRHHIRRRTSSHLELPVNSPYSMTAVNPSSPELHRRHRNSLSEGSAVSPTDLPPANLESADQTPLEDNEKSRLNRFEMMIGKRPKRWSRSPNMRRKSQGSVDKLGPHLQSSRRDSYVSRTPVHSRGSSGSVSAVGNSTYMTPADTSNPRTTLLSALPIHHVRRPSQEKDGIQVEYVESGAKIEDNGDDDDESVDPLEGTAGPVLTDEQLEKFWSDARYIMDTLRIMQHRRITHCIVKKRGIQKRDKIQCDDNMNDTIEDTAKILTTYSKELDIALKRGNSLASNILNDYSMRVETLISTSDRILSDINTSLTLKLKLFQENADRFGSLKMMRAHRLTRFLYRVLEYAIVVVLWSIWLVVSVMRWTKYIVVLAFRAVIWMLW